jgi:hypothetical protein
MFAVEELVNRLQKSPGGRHCRFVKIDDKMGLKVYKQERMCQRCFDLQDHASQFGIAPLTMGQPFEIGKFFCYLTECAKVFGFHDDLSYISNNEFHKHKIAADKEINDLLGIQFEDGCNFNYGYIVRNGALKLVCIDWDGAEFFGITIEQDEEDAEFHSESIDF